MMPLIESPYFSRKKLLPITSSDTLQLTKAIDIF